jgi:signal transduction histidine kinase
VVNAIEAVKESKVPKIILSAEQTLNKKVILKIGDNGQGMPEELMEKIFIPFFTTKKNGGGIGLSLCKQIVMLHRGTIQVHSMDGKGTVFSLQF